MLSSCSSRGSQVHNAIRRELFPNDWVQSMPLCTCHDFGRSIEIVPAAGFYFFFCILCISGVAPSEVESRRSAPLRLFYISGVSGYTPSARTPAAAPQHWKIYECATLFPWPAAIRWFIHVGGIKMEFNMPRCRQRELRWEIYGCLVGYIGALPVTFIAAFQGTLLTIDMFWIDQHFNSHTGI